MKLTMRVRKKALLRKTGLLSAAFVLAFSGLAVVVPQMVQRAYAETRVVNNEAELIAAAADPNVTGFGIKSSFEVHQTIVFSNRPVWIDANNNTITYAGGATNGWHGEYVFQAFKSKLQLKNIKLTGGDAGVYANGAELVLQGKVDVSGNEFGGIEVSQGKKVTTPASLRLDPGTTLVDTTEKLGLPAVWTDDADTADATVTGPFTLATHVKPNQKQYYLNAENAGVVATNETQERTYGTLQAAVTDAKKGDTIRLDADVTLTDSSINLNKDDVTLKGNGHTIFAAFTGTNGTPNAAALYIPASGVTVEGLTVDGTDGAVLHGIQVYRANDVALNNVTVTNNSKSGLLVNGSVVAVDSLTTINNAWNGVNVDNDGAHLTVTGVSTHQEPKAVHIYIDDRSGDVSVDDKDGQYVYRKDVAVDGKKNTTNAMYTLRSATPVATVVVDEAAETVTVSAEDTTAIKSHWVEIKAPNGTLYYVTDMKATSSRATFALNTARDNDKNLIPVDENGKLLLGDYRIRYVATDKNDIRSDADTGSTYYTMTVKAAPVDTEPNNNEGTGSGEGEGTNDGDTETTTPEGESESNSPENEGDGQGSDPAVPVQNPGQVQGQSTTRNTTVTSRQTNIQNRQLAVTPPANDGTVGVLGAETTADGEESAPVETPNRGVKGAEVEQNFANTVAEASTQASLAWYWWAIFVAAAGALLWWVIAAASSKRKSDF